MERGETQGHTPKPNPHSPSILTSKNWHRVGWALISTLGIMATVAIANYALQNGAPNGRADTKEEPRIENFRGWGKPDLAIVLTGQQFGYDRPCGCSSPQYGGLERRYNFVTRLKQKGWPVVALDLGDIPQKSGPQKNLKYATAMKALDLIGYSAVGIGKREMDMPLWKAISEYTLNNPNPKLMAANILNPKQKIFLSMIHKTDLVETKNGTPKVGVIGMIGPSVNSKVNDIDLVFHENNALVLTKSFMKLKDKSDINVLLYQGSNEEAEACARFAAASRKNNPAFPRLDVILCLSKESEPPSVPGRIPGTPTLIINIGHKGKYVGVLGAFRTNRADQPYQLQYELVAMGPDLDDPEGKEADNPVGRLIIDYAREVKMGEYIKQFPVTPHPVQATLKEAEYVGSRRCMGCHEHSYEIWEKSGHAHAFKTLVDVKHPPYRDQDGECVRCHVIGFSHPTGYGDALRKNNTRMIRRLKDVGCESCHGPASEHVADPRNKKIHALINPWKFQPDEKPAVREARLKKIDFFCQSCHDIDNDVHWNFSKKWPKIIHHMPRKSAQNSGQNPGANPVIIPQENLKIEGAKAVPVNSFEPTQTFPASNSSSSPTPPRNRLFQFRFFRNRKN